MEFLLYVICTIFFLFTIIIALKIISLKNIKYKNPEIFANKKILIVYYSNCGNTKNIAENLHSVIGGDLREIQPIEKYPKNIFTMSKLIRKQMKDDYIPQIEGVDISDYDIIFAGSPVWNFSISLPLKSFLRNNQFENKTIIPFFTCSGGANRNKIIHEIKNLTNKKDITKPLFMFENGIFLTKEQIIKWLNNI